MTNDELRDVMRWTDGDTEHFARRFPRLCPDLKSVHAKHSTRVGRGWAPLIARVLEIAEPDSGVRGVSIRAIDGMLRIELLGAEERPDLERAVADAAAASEAICEACGAAGELVVNGYAFLTRCPDHRPETARRFADDAASRDRKSAHGDLLEEFASSMTALRQQAFTALSIVLAAMCEDQAVVVAARGAVVFLNRRLMQGKAEGDSGLDESIRKAAFVLLHHP